MSSLFNSSTIAPVDGSVSRQVSDGDAAAKITKVLPAKPATENQDSLTNGRLVDTFYRHLSFFEAFGAIGIPMLLILLLSFVWTLWLIFAVLEPNSAANKLMGTNEYDNGHFWLIIDTNRSLTLAGTVGLVFVGLSYLFVALKIVVWRDKVLTLSTAKRLQSRLLDSWNDSRLESKIWTTVVGPRCRQGLRLWKELSSFNGKNRKFWNVYTKVVDLIMQTIVLIQLLRRGSPVELVYGFAVFLALNSLSCALNILTDRFSALTEALIDAFFDFAAAVIFPVVTLTYCYCAFDFDREVYLTYLEKLPFGSFEQVAHVLASQSEIALFRVMFDSLRISSSLDLIVRITMNLAFCYRSKRMMEVIIWRRRNAWVSNRKIFSSNDSFLTQHKKPVPKAVAAVFAAFSVAILVVTQQSVSHSQNACSPYPECVAYAYRWSFNDDLCPCLIYIDVDRSPKTYEEWINPVDAYAKIKKLATPGLLVSMQVINRQLLEFPDELHSCRNLKAIQLMYTSIQGLPSWMKDLNQLEMLHIEGKLGKQNLRELPTDLFSNMPRLTLIHFGVHEDINEFPLLTGVPQLQFLSLAWIFRLRQLPEFDRVPLMRQLTLTVMPMLERIPDVSSLKNLVDVSFRLCRLCCNGFLGQCDLSSFVCSGNHADNISPASCIAKNTAPYTENAAQTTLKKFGPGLCELMPLDDKFLMNIPTKETIDMCDGKPFRQCHIGNFTGICYNTRFQVLACLIHDSYIAMRRFQIEKGVGPVCDPVEEKWLGCES